MTRRSGLPGGSVLRRAGEGSADLAAAVMVEATLTAVTAAAPAEVTTAAAAAAAAAPPADVAGLRRREEEEGAEVDYIRGCVQCLLGLRGAKGRRETGGVRTDWRQRPR